MISFKNFVNECYDYSSVQVRIESNIARMMIDFGNEIPDDQLAGKGREDNPHITIKYGLLSNDPAVLDNVMLPSIIHAVMGKTSLFRSKEFDVLKVDIQSTDMVSLNAAIVAGTENVNTHPEYHPHATIAYLLPGMGDKYIGDNRFEGVNLIFEEIEFSGSDDKITSIKL